MIRFAKIAATQIPRHPLGFSMPSRLAVVIRLFLFVFIICFLLMFVFASLPVIIVTALILTLMQGINFLFVNIGMSAIYKDDDGYQQAKRLGYDPFFDSLPNSINPNANRTCYVLPYPEPEYNGFEPPAWWRFQCMNCFGRVDKQIGKCWNCNRWLG